MHNKFSLEVFCFSYLDEKLISEIALLESKSSFSNPFNSASWVRASHCQKSRYLCAYHENSLVFFLPVQLLFSPLTLVLSYVNPLWSDYSLPLFDSHYLSDCKIDWRQLTTYLLSKFYPISILFLRNVPSRLVESTSSCKSVLIEYTSSSSVRPSLFAETSAYKKSDYYLRKLSISPLIKGGLSSLARVVDSTDLDCELIKTIAFMKSDQYSRQSISKPINPRFWFFLASQSDSSLSVVLTSIHNGKNLISGSLSVLYNNVLYYILPVYSLAYKQYSPGLIDFRHLCDFAFTRGIELIDLTIGDEPYKKRYGATPAAIGSLVFSPFVPPSLIAFAIRLVTRFELSRPIISFLINNLRRICS
jgi:CelD/BcsL family acetyltransferase involved in cellulose biosynthesis